MYDVPGVADIPRRPPGWQRLGCVLVLNGVPNGRCSAPRVRVTARVSSLALFHGYGVVASEKDDVQEVGSGGRIDECFTASVAFMRGIPDPTQIRVVRVRDTDDQGCRKLGSEPVTS
jgi:hypothetical protein